MIRNLLSVFFVLSTFVLLAQPGVAPVKTIGGKKFYIHKVEAGNTLYGLQRTYGVSIEEIVKANSGELDGGLKVGQEVKIPVPEEETVETVVVETSDYKIKGGETLYGISRKFNTTVDELIKLNPGVENGISKGQVIQVPGKVVEELLEEPVVEEENDLPNPFVVEDKETEQVKVVFNDSIVEHTVLDHETMYSISKRYMISVEELMKYNNLRSASINPGQVLKIPLKQERIERVTIKEVPPAYNPDGSGELVFDRKDRYKIVVLVPFYLDYGAGYSEYVSNMATQFYMGTQVALDSLRKKGLNADVYYIDTKNDSAHVTNVLHGDQVAGADIIIGPFFPKTQKIVAEYCKTNKVRMILPVSASKELLSDNRLIYSTVPDDEMLMQYTAEYLAENEKKANIILIQVSKDKDKLLYDKFKSTYQTLAAKNGAPALKESSTDNVKNYIIRGSRNIFIVPTNDKNTAMKFMNTLNKSAFRAKSDDLIIYGTKDWMDFNDVNGIYRDKFNFHFLSNTYLDYDDDYVMETNRKFRVKYNTDLSKMVAQGYDVMLFSGLNLLLEAQEMRLLMNRFSFEQSGESGAYLNKDYFVLEQEEFELIDNQNAVNGSK